MTCFGTESLIGCWIFFSSADVSHSTKSLVDQSASFILMYFLMVSFIAGEVPTTSSFFG